jgi:hypothetical protein
MNVQAQTKLEELAESEGYASVDAMLGAAVCDSVCPAICLHCSYTDELEPDQDRGWCPECETGTMKSALRLAGLI